MRRLISSVVLFFMIASLGVTNIQAATKNKKKSRKKGKTEVVADTTAKKKTSKDTYEKLLKGAVSQEGFFKVHQVKGKLYFEIPKSLISRDFLISSRVSSTSNNKDIAAGQMPRNPLLVTFSADTSMVYMHKKNVKSECDTTTSMYSSFLRNHLDPIWNSYKIESLSPDSSAYVVDVTSLFLGDVPELSPFRNANIFDALADSKPLSGSLSSSKSALREVKAFPMNINIKSMMSYEADGPFTAVLTRNVVLLSETPMRPRIADDRIGYFSENRRRYSENEDGLEEYEIINRWDIRPKKEDVEKHRNGEMVEPEKPIVYYVDPAIPEKWRSYIKQGIEDWQAAFEEIGFKNAIVAKDYPENDPDFDPDDIRYSCYRLITTPVENSMGPSWIDPRSGEIIQGDVLFYSNALRLLHNWRFVQTATVDPRVRKSVFDDDLMGSSLRYLAAHEVGHTLGLMHNFGASYAFPVDSLRSASFTQKYGTTPSIMDYTRYNYVAQPGDEGVRLSPPDLGVYDIFAIKWGYAPIYDAAEPEDEIAVLDSWIAEKAGDPMYKYGPQPFINEFDPSCQSEDLGNDAIKAGQYGIANLKILMENLLEWTADDDRTYDKYLMSYKELCNQFQRYLIHANTYLGGLYVESSIRGDGKKVVSFTPEKRQKEALKFIFDSMKDAQTWIENQDIRDHLGPLFSVSHLQSVMVMRMFFTSISSSLAMYEEMNPKEAYTYKEFMDDLYNIIWENTLKGRSLSLNERNMQLTYINKLLDLSGTAASGKSSPLRIASENMTDMEKMLLTDPGEVSWDGSFVRYTPNTLADYSSIKSPIYYKKLMDSYKLLQRMQNSGNEDTRMHYQSLLFRLKRIIESK